MEGPIAEKLEQGLKLSLIAQLIALEFKIEIGAYYLELDGTAKILFNNKNNIANYALETLAFTVDFLTEIKKYNTIDEVVNHYKSSMHDSLINARESGQHHVILDPINYKKPVVNKYCINCGSVLNRDSSKSNTWVVYLTCENANCRTEVSYKTEDRGTVSIIKPSNNSITTDPLR